MSADEKVDSHRLTRSVELVTANGELDLYTAPELREAMFSAIRNGATVVVVDLLEVSFVDSTALGVLVEAAKKMRSSGGLVSIACNDPNVVKVFELTGLTRLMAVRPSLSDAVAAVSASSAPVGSTFRAA